MTIRFAAAHGGSASVIVRSLCRSAPLDAVNDNPSDILAYTPHAELARRKSGTLTKGRSLTEALRHFAIYGLSAASTARDQAKTAQSIGDSESRDRWIAICRQLDRRMADRCDRELSGRG